MVGILRDSKLTKTFNDHISELNQVRLLVHLFDDTLNQTDPVVSQLLFVLSAIEAVMIEKAKEAVTHLLKRLVRS